MRTVGLTFNDDSAKPLTNLKKDDLIALAAAEGVDVDPGATKAAIVAAIEENRTDDGDSA
jgi:hypothetical protein